MRAEKVDSPDLLLAFAANTIKTSASLSSSYIGRHAAGQLMRCATSAGANWEETCGAESRSDFIHKMQIVLKELRESLCWLRLIDRTNLIPKQSDDLNVLLREATELVNLIAKSVVTAKGK